MYAVRTLRKSLIQQRSLPNHLFKWVPSVLSISDEEILECSGLDAFVVLSFFKFGIRVFLLILIMCIFILSPIRYYFTGAYDKDNIVYLVVFNFSSHGLPPLDEEFPRYLWLYPIFTYVFSGVVYVMLFRYTNLIISTRQKYLASQNSITDRTIKVDGIPKSIIKRNDPLVLKKFIEDLGIGRVENVKLIYNWTPLEKMFDQRKRYIESLERLYSQYFDLSVDLFNHNHLPRVIPKNAPTPIDANTQRKRKIKAKIETLSVELGALDKKIKEAQAKYDQILSTYPIHPGLEYKLLLSAFITMDSVASAQMAAQTILDPRVYKLVVSLAPAAKDINWRNLKLSYFEKLTKSHTITFIIILSYLVIFFLVTSLSTLIDIKTITKFWPEVGHVIAKSKWLSTFVTGILPPALFSLMNIAFPYLYRSLTMRQGYPLSSEVELLTLLKNFFFIFFILFLVFTITGTLWDYVSTIGDTKKFAAQLASSLKKLSLFYVDLILLQGLAMFPVKLLQLGDFFIVNVLGKLIFLKSLVLRTPRDYRYYYYTPPVFDFGLNLPQHILVFIIILIYSVVSTKIVASGLVYFLLGYFVYKYQLMYSYVHPPHSTGKVWPMIFRRLIFGLVIFQMFMCGTLALEGAIILSILCTPLFVITLVVEWNFEKYYLPLHNFIALRAIQNPDNYDNEFDDDLLLISDPTYNTDAGVSPAGTHARMLRHDATSEAASMLDAEETSLLDGDFSVSYNAGAIHHRRKVSTVDEEREQFTDYTYPYLIDPLGGPWIGFEGDYISTIEYRDGGCPNIGARSADDEGTSGDDFVLRKRIQVLEWE